MAYSGRYIPTKPKKYKGDPSKIVYRSLWERKFMVYCDRNSAVLEWGSEEFFIPYTSPADGRKHRYFPDFYVKIKGRGKYVVEVKPFYQTQEPKTQKRHTKRYINEVVTYAVNQAKWKAAQEFCDDRRIEFKIITEKELGLT